MITFDSRIPVSSAWTNIILWVLTGAALGAGAWFALTRIPSVPEAAALPGGVGVGALVAVGMVVNTLFTSLSRVWVDDQALHLRTLLGRETTYPRAGNTFAPFLRQQQYQGKVTTVSRSLHVTGATGEKYLHMDLSPAHFSDLITALTREATQPAATAGEQGPPAPAGSGPAASALEFTTRTFIVDPLKGVRPMRAVYSILAVLALAVGIGVFGWFAADDRTTPGLIILGTAALIAGTAWWGQHSLRRRARRIPHLVAVAPEGLILDELTIPWADIAQVRTKPGDRMMHRFISVETHAGEKVHLPLGLDDSPGIFRQHAAFVALLHKVSTASNGFMVLDHS